MSCMGYVSSLIRPPAASRSLVDHRGWHPRPRIALELAQEPGGRPSWRLVGNFLGQPKESFTKPFDPFGVYLKGKYPTHSVHERADVWWASLLRTRFEDGAVDVAWDEFVRLFRAKFVPEHVQDRMEQEFLSLTQGSMTVLEYEARFSELSKYAPHIVTDERRKTKKFVMGLKPSLRTRLVPFDHRTLDESLSAACR
ncbi:hypothetical protein Taro_000603 [Colocasia esculenta]|uniref:Retrotransposon gag domain-containing protein n=1 Tax=Colocasia esculenta TaxID=4460 RepID=A0A843TCK2_COLES|nr:hypothetical protein [Colocasia esculenta]